ncbi:MAG: AMP-binding protein [Acidimicrobiales bacterium]
MPGLEMPRAGTVAALLDARGADQAPGLRCRDESWTWAAVVAESRTRAALAAALRTDGPWHIGVLLPNVPEYVFWIGGAALAGATIVGINPTRRGAELGHDIRHADCQLLVTDAAGAELLRDVDTGIDPARTLRVDDPGWPMAIGPAVVSDPISGPTPDDLLFLLFTSGTTGAPKAVRCTQRRMAGIAENVVGRYGFVREDVCYCPMPLFHGNALMALWGGAVRVGACVALPTEGRFSARGFLADVRHYGATYFTYVGKALTYILATEERPDDADNPLTRGFGNEASHVDITRFEQRFGCRIIEGYGSSEGGAVITPVADMPDGALGVGAPGVIVADPASGEERPAARFDGQGRLLNAGDAIGEIANTRGAPGFEGYYRNPEADAERIRGGWYWSGDLGYRDEAGYFYFAGRGSDWLRVDGENFAAAPVERILGRWDAVAMAAVYAVPDPLAGDQVMAALVLRPGASFDPDRFSAFLGAQPDIGTKWSPRLVRLMADLPVTASGKVRKEPLRAAGWEVDDDVWIRDGSAYRPLGRADRDAIARRFAEHGRVGLLPRRA